MTHRAPDTGPPLPIPTPKSRTSRWLQDRFAPHYGMAAITVGYGALYATVGAAAVPQPISLGFTGTLATWFGYLIQQSRKAEKGDE